MKPSYSQENSHPQELAKLQQILFKPYGVILSDVKSEPESKEYSAHKISLNGKKGLFRVAKTTPTKIGQFVTLWKRNKDGPIEPFNSEDGIDFVIICTPYKNHSGHFIFTNDILIEKSIFSHKGKEGKRGFRVYPTWDKCDSKQAQKTQEWQRAYFLEISPEGKFDQVLANKLYSYIR